MEITTDLTLDLKKPNINTIVHAKQNDKLTRYLSASLMNGPQEWTPPANIMSAVRFKKADGTGGFYDTDEQNNPAVVYSGNKARITLAEQVISFPGPVLMELNIYNSQQEKLTTFYWVVEVEESVLQDTEIISTSYFNILSQQIADILGRVGSIAELEAYAEGIPYGEGTHVEVTGGTGAQDPYILHFYIEEGRDAEASVEKSGYVVTIRTDDAEHGEKAETITEPQLKVTKTDDVVKITATDVDGTTEETLLSGTIRLATFHIDTTTGQLVMTAPSDYSEVVFSINSAGFLIADY